MNLSQFSSLVLTKVNLNLKSEASKSYLSYLWWILEPALFVGVFYVVFGIFLASKTDNFVVFLMCGKIPFLWFSRSVNNSSLSIIGGRGLMNQINIPKAFFPVVVLFQDLFKSTFVFLVMIALVWTMGFEPSLSWLSLPVLVLVQLVFIASVSIFAAAVVPFVPDLKFIVHTCVMLMMFASGIFFSYKDVLLTEHRDLFLLNPMANLIRMYREVLMEGMWPDWDDLLMITVFCSIFILITLKVIKIYDNRYPRLVLQ